jgi:ribosomal protein L12E/L44/L45/RPP1/RPP2
VPAPAVSLPRAAQECATDPVQLVATATGAQTPEARVALAVAREDLPDGDTNKVVGLAIQLFSPPPAAAPAAQPAAAAAAAAAPGHAGPGRGGGRGRGGRGGGGRGAQQQNQITTTTPDVRTQTAAPAKTGDGDPGGSQDAAAFEMPKGKSKRQQTKPT